MNVQQLSIFQMDVEPKKPADSQPNVEVVKVESPATIEQGFDHSQDTTSIQSHSDSVPYIGQKVKVIFPTDKDSELYLYLHYYFPKIQAKVGEIVSVELCASGKYTCVVQYYSGEKVTVNSENLLLL